MPVYKDEKVVYCGYLVNHWGHFLIEAVTRLWYFMERDATIDVYPYGAITVGQRGEVLSDMEGLAGQVIAFSDDGRGVQSDDMMRQAMLRAKALNKMIVAHCEVNDLLHGGYIHEGDAPPETCPLCKVPASKFVEQT